MKGHVLASLDLKKVDNFHINLKSIVSTTSTKTFSYKIFHLPTKLKPYSKKRHYTTFLNINTHNLFKGKRKTNKTRQENGKIKNNEPRIRCCTKSKHSLPLLSHSSSNNDNGNSSSNDILSDLVLEIS